MKLVEINDLYFRTWENPNHGLATTGLAGVWARVDKGGHFAAWEQPELFAAEVRAAFGSLR